VRFFQALDEHGEAGLEAELDRIYPPENQPTNAEKSVDKNETLRPHPLALSMLLTVAEYCAKQGEPASGAVEMGLQTELNRIYPDSDLEVVDFDSFKESPEAHPLFGFHRNWRVSREK
jgi:hypothetical protein